jgi:hypothetical protein
MLNKKNLLMAVSIALVVATAVITTSAIVKPGHIKQENKTINIVKPGH